MKQPTPFKDDKSRHHPGSTPLQGEPARPGPRKAPQGRKVPISQRGGG